jgi:hypothetical protein
MVERMRRASVAAYLTIMVSTASFADVAAARQGVTVGANVIFYGDNTEFRNPFREGETSFGAIVRLDGRIDVTDAVTLTLGALGNQRFGSEDSFDLVRPIVAMTVRGKRATFVFGTLPSARPGTPPGPDRTGPHGLLPPLQRETLAFDRPYEAGLQWTFRGEVLGHEAWLQWQRLNTTAHRERLDAGIRSEWRVGDRVSVPVQCHIVHEGGQLFASGPVRDSFALGSGIILSNRGRSTPNFQLPTPNSTPLSHLPTARQHVRSLVLTLELLGLWSRYTPDREAPDPTRAGGAFFGRASAEARGWRGHLIAWRGDDFIKDEGDPNYMSLRRDGARYRGVRDYAEIGLTRTFGLAPGALVETSVRFHRVERHYEYSYRVLGVIRVDAKVR